MRKAEKNIEQVRTRFSWIEADNDRMRSELETLRQERDLLQGRLDESGSSTRPERPHRLNPRHRQPGIEPSAGEQNASVGASRTLNEAGQL